MKSKRHRILQSAQEEFLNRGFDGASIDAIVRAAGGSKSTVYSHFSDKTTLFAEALGQAQAQLDFHLPRFWKERSGRVREDLEMIAVELLTVLYRDEALHLTRIIVSESQRFPAVADRYWEEGPSTALRQVTRFLTELPEEGEITFSDPGLAARHLFGLLLGDRYLRFLLGIQEAPSPAEIVSIAREAATLFLGAARGGAFSDSE
ncbi:MAG: TetR/AcrR family transcriptional regulator [Alkalispirochaeta sp.]